MGFVPLSIVMIIVYFFAGLFLMERGLLSRFTAIVVFIVGDLPLIGAPQVMLIQGSSTVSIQLLYFPTIITGFMGTFFVIMTYIAVASVFKFLGRDPLGRKPTAKA